MTVGRLTFNEPRSRAIKASERVAQDIVRDITRRGLRTGDRLPLEAAMVEEYAIGRTSLREALRILEVQGLISLKPGPGGGAVVGKVEPRHLARTAALYFHLSGATYADLMASQVLLEGTCARLAATHPDREAVLAAWFDHEFPAETAAYRRVTLGFHTTVYDLAANPVHTLVSQAISDMVTKHVVMTMDPVELRASIVEEHSELARVIASGDADRADRMMSEHFRSQHEYLRRRSPSRIQENIQWR
jgi:DNA-binding FadR family transcriptional regulator